MDGANVEMYEEVGPDNMFIFGMSSDEVIAHEHNRDYDPMQIFNTDQDIRKSSDTVSERILLTERLRTFP